MRGAYDEIVATAVKRQHEPQRVVADLLVAEINEKQARSIKYQMTIAKLPDLGLPMRNVVYERFYYGSGPASRDDRRRSRRFAAIGIALAAGAAAFALR
jgi:hypothetical protein